ncbi:hypothetical protein [Pseudoclostridium thermosuccinogenes]|uniref:hypothetical protein n=1 Tax=Clostridium thermosuccinogenes TaxID=84032 RepID=UPI00137A97BC
MSKNEWGGCQLWDADFWLFRAILPLWPEFAKAILSFREKTLEKAKEHARVTGYKGAWYAWMTDEEGSITCLLNAGTTITVSCLQE